MFTVLCIEHQISPVFMPFSFDVSENSVAPDA